MFDVRDFLERAMQQQKNLLNDYEDPLPQQVQAALGPAYQSDQIDLFLSSKHKNQKNWGDQPYRRSQKYPEQLKHRNILVEWTMRIIEERRCGKWSIIL